MSSGIGVVVDAHPDEVAAASAASASVPIICAQCNQTAAGGAQAGFFCQWCGGMLTHEVATVFSDEAAAASPPSSIASVHTSAPAVLALLASIDPHARARMDWGTRLWDCAPSAFDKARASKHTAKAMATFFAELTKVERAYASGLAKIAAAPEFGAQLEANELKPPMISTLTRAWAQVKADVAARSRAHTIFADTLAVRVEAQFEGLRKLLSVKKEKLEEGVSVAAKQLKDASEAHAKLKAKHEKLASEFAQKGAASKLTAADVSLVFDAETTAQLAEFRARNAYNRTLSENLTKLQEVELERLGTTRRLLMAHRLAQSEMERKYLKSEAQVYKAVQAIDEVAETVAWTEAHHSKNACPWASEKTALTVPAQADPMPVSPTPHVMVGSAVMVAGGMPVASPNAVSASSSSFDTVPPTHSSAPRASAVGLSSARTGAVVPVPKQTASPPLEPRQRRNSRSNSLVLSPEAVALIASSSPIIAELAAQPALAASSLPAHVRLAELPFPTIGLSKRVEPLPPTSWTPVLTSLFPGEDPSSLPDISCLNLSAQEYNRLVYEQLLLSTNLLLDIAKSDHRDTLVRIVRVQLNIPQSEHDMLLKVLSVDQGVLANSPTNGLLSQQEQKSVHLRQRSAQSDDAGDAPVLHVAESMLYVNYRLHLIKSVKSSRFPNLTLYSSWFKRQVHAIWLAILWTMQAERNAAAQSAKQSAASSVPLKRFKLTLQLIQLLAFSLSSKIETKLFQHGDSISVDHPDMLVLFKELEATLDLFPPPYRSVVADSLQYPPLMLNRVYSHLIHIACITGGDETGRPLQKDQDDGSGSEDEEGISLHESYLAVIASLSSVRNQWKVTEFYHQYSLLHLILHIIYWQASEYDGKLLDADGMLEAQGDRSLVPLLAYVTDAICGQLRPEVASLIPPTRGAERIRPESLDEDERRFLCFALRNIGYAMADYHKFHSPPVTICMQFLHDIATWFGVGDVAARMERLMRISTTNFYQTLIPTEQLLLMPPLVTGPDALAGQKPKRGSLGKPASQPNPFELSDNESSRPVTPVLAPLSASAQMQITPKRMHSWSVDEWKLFTKHLGAFVRDQIEEFQAEFDKNRSLVQVFGSNKARGITPDDAKDDEAKSHASLRPNAAEVCILQALRCFQQDVNQLLSDRLKSGVGMDETFISLVSSLVRLQNVLMDSDYADFWTSMTVKREIASVFPSLQQTCAQAMRRWMDVQKTKVEGIRERCVSLDAWSPMDMSGHKYSHSVNDLFQFLNTLHEGFWSHARTMQGFGASDSLPYFISFYSHTLAQYGAQIVESAGLDVIPQVLPSKDTKLKQAKEAPTTKDKAKSFVKGLFKNEKEQKDEEEVGVMPMPELPQKGLVVQTIQSLCVRLCCIEAAIQNSSDLSHSLRTHAQSFIDVFPIVAPAGSRRNTADKSEVEATMKAAKRWALWQGCFVPPSRMPKPDTTNVFGDAVRQMREQIEQLAGGIGVAKVYVDWRSAWLTKLYQPMPLDSTRIVNGELEGRIEESMPIVHQCLTSTLFPCVAKQILVQLLSAVQYVVLYGRRSIQADQVRTIVRGDVASLVSTFSRIVSEGEMAQATAEIEQLLAVMDLPTDDLIQMYTTQKAPLPFPIMARIIAARSGKNAGKLIDKIRGK